MYASVLYYLNVPILISKVHVSKILFHPKISPINMAMYPLFAVPASRTRRTDPREGGRGGRHHRRPLHLGLWPPLLLLYSKEVGGGWSIYFLFSPNFYFYIMAEF